MGAEYAGDGLRTVKGDPGELIASVIEEARGNADPFACSYIGQGGIVIVAVEVGDSGLAYEAIGPHFQSNPYHLDADTLIRHGMDIIDVPRTFDGIRDYLWNHNIEGIVFWKDGEPRCKIKRSDFGFAWPEK